MLKEEKIVSTKMGEGGNTGALYYEQCNGAMFALILSFLHIARAAETVVREPSLHPGAAHRLVGDVEERRGRERRSVVEIHVGLCFGVALTLQPPSRFGGANARTTSDWLFPPVSRRRLRVSAEPRHVSMAKNLPTWQIPVHPGLYVAFAERHVRVCAQSEAVSARM